MSDQKPVSSELEGLFVEDGEQAIDAVLRSALENLVGLTRDGRLIPKPAFQKLSDPNRVLVALLAKQAMARLRIPDAGPEATADRLAEECMVPVKSCREYLSRFKSRRLLDKNQKGYFIPAWAVSSVAEAVQKKG